MGIDTHSLHLLRYATRKFGGLGNTITLGRLAVLLGPHASRKWVGTARGSYCEPLLTKHFGASKVDSIDNSPYEGANIIADMNQELPAALKRQYDAVIDFGCSEHIFDIAQALRNVASLCKIGGTILHAVPANGFCGHGFYQFSPELFFSCYSRTNGYADTEVFLADLCDIKNWYRVSLPVDGNRINVRSYGELYVLVVTKRVATAPETVQQSDYEFTWANSNGAVAPPHPPGRMAHIREICSKTRLTARLTYALDATLAPNGAKRLRGHHALTRISLTRK